jgi:hypothetical protein
MQAEKAKAGFSFKARAKIKICPGDGGSPLVTLLSTSGLSDKLELGKWLYFGGRLWVRNGGENLGYLFRTKIEISQKK